MRPGGAGVPVPAETLGPPPVGGDADQEVGQPPGGLRADLPLHRQVPPVAQRRLVVRVETHKVVEIFQSWGKGIKLVSNLKILIDSLFIFDH